MTGAWERVPALAAEHLTLAAAALALGTAVALPLGIWAAGRPRVARVAIGAAALIQTIPALALLALFYPVLLWIGGWTGTAIPALGFLPALLALALYALLPVLRNTVAGLRGLDPAIREAADGVGLSPRQRLWWVEAPLVAPVAMAGIRTAAVWTIGAATLATTVGQPSLGDLIFSGLQTQAWPLVVAGCVAAALLAVTVDALLGWSERGVAAGRGWQAAAPLALLAAATLGAWSWTVAPAAGDGKTVVTVGAKNFAEQFILARVIGARLERAGYRVRYREGLGSSVAYAALSQGTIDVYVDYTGTLWSAEMRRGAAPPRPALIRAVADWTRANGGVRLLGPLGFENAYAFAMRGADARRAGIATLADLATASPRLRLAADLEFLNRREWAAVRDAYAMRFAGTRAYSPSFLYDALGSGRAEVAAVFSSDGRIAADGLAVLSDPKGAIPGYDAVLLLGPARAGDRAFAEALRPLVGRIPVAAMRQANHMVDRTERKATPEQAARWLARRIGL